MPYVGCIRYVDPDGTDREYSYIRDVTDLAALETFVNAVAPMLGATATKVGFTETKFLDVAGTGNNPDLDRHLQINLRDEDGNRRGFMLPAISIGCFELINGCYRLKETYGDQLAEYYSTLTGITCTFVSGALVGPA